MQPERKVSIYLVLAVVVGLIAGYLLAGSTGSDSPGERESVDHSAHVEGSDTEGEEQWWTCSMHPQIRKPGPGQCPICGMDLIPIDDRDSTDAGERQIRYSEAAIKLMALRTSRVERRFAEAEVRMVGKVTYDETRLRHIAAWVSGRIDRMYADFVGTRINKGDHMFDLYSPQLFSAQQELLQSFKASTRSGRGSSELLKRTTRSTLEAAREKLKLLGLKPGQIEQIRKSGKPREHLTIYAPIGGIVIDKNATEGAYVDAGTKIYTIADLSEIWVKLDAYESDIPWIRYGQEVEFTTEAYPGKKFRGRISFIDPQLDPRTRTVKLRVNVDNADTRLKPEMFVRAVVRPRIAGEGKVMDPHMAGKWICPMHPSVIKDSANTCDICGMDLITTESLGYEAVDANAPPLIIPASAALVTGKRAVVYVELPGGEMPTFEGREITLGPRAGDYYIVKSGLAEGERVVTNGNFKIDSDLQIRAKPSMMSNPVSDR